VKYSQALGHFFASRVKAFELHETLIEIHPGNNLLREQHLLKSHHSIYLGLKMVTAGTARLGYGNLA
jgi:hypothetical protein